jgi:threonine aldolase
MEIIDLRSDTVTQPTAEMRRAMAEAEVGDDVYGEDPTVNRLEAEAAELFGQEAGLLVTSGTQGNLVALLTHAPRGSEVIVGDKAHIFVYEQGGLAALGGLIPHTVPVQSDGTLRLEDIRRAIRGDDDHFPRSRVVALENTQGTVGGVAVSAEYTRQVAELAQRQDMRLHIDGARVFNAAVAFNLSPQEMMAGADSLTFCLSKGLGAPAGSVLVGPRDFIREARRYRKVLGGGMRQAGVLAAAGLVGLHRVRPQLAQDHAHAAYLAEQLAGIDDIEVESRHTNFVFFHLTEDAAVAATELPALLEREKILLRPYPGYVNRFRVVLHHWIDQTRIDQVVSRLKTLLG